MLQKLKDQLEKEYTQVEIQITWLIKILYALLIILIAFIGWSLYENEYKDLIDLFTPMIPLLAAILFANASNRLIINDKISKLKDRDNEILRITHYQIAISKDMRQKINYLKSRLQKNKVNSTPIILMTELATTIENRYENLLLDKDSYKHLQGNSVDTLVNLSGSIFNYKTYAESLKLLIEINKSNGSNLVLNKNPEKVINNLTYLSENLQKYIDALFELRSSIEDKTKNS